MTSTTKVIADPRTGCFVDYEADAVAGDARQSVRAEIDARASDFEAGTMLVGGREVPTPRLVLAFGDGRYRYPDMGASLPWPPNVGALRTRLEISAGHRFNYALVNRYRDGSDFTGWHADKVAMHVPGTSIAIVSLGAVRPLRFRRLQNGAPTAEVLLGDGSLLWMRGATQSHYEHSIPADSDIRSERLSITFRFILEPATS